MNKLIIPPCPNWYETSILACAPDNTLIYGSRNDIVIVYDTPYEASDVKTIPRSHSQKIISVNLNKNWGNPNKLLVTTAEDWVVKLWNVETLEKKMSHSIHKTNSTEKVIGATFAGDDRIISVSEEGHIVVWNVPLNQTTLLKDVFGFKVNVSCISTCPHVNWMTAFGLKGGLVIVTDLRKQGKVLHKLRGHDRVVTSLAWCPIPVNIFPKKPGNIIAGRKVTRSAIEDSKKNLQVAEGNTVEDVSQLQGRSDDTGELMLDMEIDKNVEKTDSFGDAGENMEGDGATTSNVTDTEYEVKEKAHPLLKIYDTENIDSVKEFQALTDEVVSQETDFAENLTENEKLHRLSEVEQAIIGNEEDDNVAMTVGDAMESSAIENSESRDVEEGASGEVKREIPLDEPEEEELRKEFLLASAGKDGKIYIWRAGTDGRMQAFLNIHPKKKYYKSKKLPDRIWIPLCWIAPHVLLSSSKNGELAAWNLPKQKNNIYTPIHNHHTSLLFSIVGTVTIYNEYDWLKINQHNLTVWTLGQDRLLINTILSNERRTWAYYPTISTVECFATSPVDPNRLALGMGEGVVKIWDLTSLNIKCVTMASFSQKIHNKVSTIAWHPVKESVLAFGTVEGRIGYIDTVSKAKVCTLLPSYFNNQIHKLEWGPVKGKASNFGLYAVAEGALAVFDVNRPDLGPREVIASVYTFSWKPTYDVLLVTAKNGPLLAYNPEMTTRSVYPLQRKLQTICWHPDAAQKDVATAYSKWFASICCFKEIMVYNFDMAVDVNCRIVAMYKCADVINSLAWSPYEPTQLVVGTTGGIAQICDVVSGTVLSTFINEHFQTVWAVTWSPVDSNFMITTGRDRTIRVWDIREWPPRNEHDIAALKNKSYKGDTEDPADPTVSEIEKSSGESAKGKKPKKNTVLPSLFDARSDVISDLHELLAWKENSDSQNHKKDLGILQFFGSSEDMEDVISANEAIHKIRGRYDHYNTLQLFKGDMGTAIKSAIDEKRVNQWVIMMAPMVSPKLWKTACEVYARQLMDEMDSDPMEIATCFLACHKLEEAIDALCTGALFKEALALAKSRLAPGDPAVIKIIEKWASYSHMVGNFEAAAQCNIFLGKYEEAASALFRRSDVKALKLAVELAEKTGNEELHKAILFRYNAFKSADEKESPTGAKANVETLPTKIEAMLAKYKDTSETDDEKGTETESLVEEPVAVENLQATGEEVVKMLALDLAKLQVVDKDEPVGSAGSEASQADE